MNRMIMMRWQRWMTMMGFQWWDNNDGVAVNGR